MHACVGILRPCRGWCQRVKSILIEFFATFLINSLFEGAWNPREVDRNGSSGMLWAAGGGHLACCVYLADVCGLDPTEQRQKAHRGYSGRTPLHYAARNGHLHVVRWLIEEKGCPVDQGTADGTTAFCWAVWQGHEQVCRYLIEKGASPTTVNSYGCNAAMWACQGKATISLCDYLFEGLKVPFNLINANGQGCIHKAAQRGRHALCEWLLHGAPALANKKELINPNAHEKSTPSQLADYAGFTELAEWLKNQEALLNGS
eukprot:m.97757 g.97757  ORF g.97757 m.97757 type:complete len:260 (+) comp13612_c0_seq2:2079-2858(+)